MSRLLQSPWLEIGCLIAAEVLFAALLRAGKAARKGRRRRRAGKRRRAAAWAG